MASPSAADSSIETSAFYRRFRRLLPAAVADAEQKLARQDWYSRVAYLDRTPEFPDTDRRSNLVSGPLSGHDDAQLPPPLDLDSRKALDRCARFGRSAHCVGAGGE